MITNAVNAYLAKKDRGRIEQRPVKGKSKGGMTTKLHLFIAADCHVIEGFLTGGNSHDVTVAEELTAEVVGCYILADRGYDSDRYRTELESLRKYSCDSW